MREPTRQHVGISHRSNQEDPEMKQWKRKVVTVDKMLLIRKRCCVEGLMAHSRDPTLS